MGLEKHFAPLVVCGGTHVIDDGPIQQLGEEISSVYAYDTEEFEVAFCEGLCHLQHPNAAPIVGAPIEVGDAILYDPRTWHGGMPNLETEFRHAMYINFHEEQV